MTLPFELFFVLVLGLLVGVLVPRYWMDARQFGLDSLTVIVLGFSLFFISKLSLFLKGVWGSWGSGKMGKPFKYLYYGGYGLMIAGVVGVLPFVA